MSLVDKWLRDRRQNRTTRLGIRLACECLEDRAVPTLLGQQLFPSDNPWNQQIAGAPVAADSAAIINNIINMAGDNRIHPDFGQDYRNSGDLYGIPINVVHGNSTTKLNVAIDAYSDESDLQNVPIPANAVIEGDYQNGPRVGVDNRSDSHLIVWDEDNNIAYELYRASRPSENSDGKWHADQETVWNMKANTFRTIGWTSADAAGLSILAGLVRPDEALPASEGGQGLINHAIRFTLQNSIILDQFLYPASHVANSGSNAAVQPPMGARFRLKAGVDISQLNPESKVIAQAMKDYGMIVADNGSNFFFSGASYSVNANNQFALTFNDDDIQDTTHGLKSLRFSDFEVVDLTPIVTGLSAHQAAAGTSITINGQNFSGAAGHLQVLFGSTAATAFTIVDDSHLTAIVPTGTGTVDVRVQSGISVAADSQNSKSTIFGYGISANTVNDDFQFGEVANKPPTVAIAARANPSMVTGRSTKLTVRGADDRGESNLTYTWSIVSKPAGATDPQYSANGTNAAKNTVVTFPKAGSYTFRVTIADAGGLNVASIVRVTVRQTLTAITITPGSTTVLIGSMTQFSAMADDQFGNPLARQPYFFWRVIGKGTITSRGLYHAPNVGGGPYTIMAQSGLIKATIAVTVID